MRTIFQFLVLTSEPNDFFFMIEKYLIQKIWDSRYGNILFSMQMSRYEMNIFMVTHSTKSILHELVMQARSISHSHIDPRGWNHTPETDSWSRHPQGQRVGIGVMEVLFSRMMLIWMSWLQLARWHPRTLSRCFSLINDEFESRIMLWDRVL